MREGKIEKIDELVEKILEDMGITQKFKECEVCSVWPEVVGKMIASRTKEVRMADGRLFVTFTSAAVRNEILMVKEGLIGALNDRVGRKVVQDIVMK